MPLPDWDKASPYSHTAAFRYDVERDLYHCPRRQLLKREWIDESRERVIYRARTVNCNAYPVKNECTNRT